MTSDQQGGRRESFAEAVWAKSWGKVPLGNCGPTGPQIIAKWGELSKGKNHIQSIRRKKKRNRKVQYRRIVYGPGHQKPGTCPKERRDGIHGLKGERGRLTNMILRGGGKRFRRDPMCRRLKCCQFDVQRRGVEGGAVTYSKGFRDQNPAPQTIMRHGQSEAKGGKTSIRRRQGGHASDCKLFLHSKIMLQDH